MTKVAIYTDGGCRGNPGVGGWGVVLLYKDKQKLLKGRVSHTTNNRMELQAVIEGLKALKYTVDVDVYTDSKYVQQGASVWMPKWKLNGWKSSGKASVKNQELWQQLDSLINQHRITWHWVKGHSGNRYNELADQLANQAMDQGAV